MDAIIALHNFRESRRREKVLRENLRIANDFLQNSVEYKNIMRIGSEIEKELDTQEELRKVIVDFAASTYNLSKSMLPGVDIVVSKVTSYDAVIARGWCLRNLTTALVLDKPLFEKIMRMIAKNDAPISPLPDFVKVSKEVSVVIIDSVEEGANPNNRTIAYGKAALETLYSMLPGD